MTRTAALARAGLVVSAAFLLSRLLGYVRGSTMAAVFGLSAELDAFYAAFRLPDLMFQLVAAGALSAALVPILSGLLATNESQRAWRIVSTVATLILIALLILAVIFFVAAPVIVPLITSFEGEQLRQTIELTRIMLLSPILLALGAVATSALNARGRFAAAAIAPSVYNVGIIFGALVLSPLLGTTVDGTLVPNPVGLAIGVVLGSLGHVLVQLPPLSRLGFRFQPNAMVEDPLAKKAFLLMAPRAVGLGASQITFVVITILATGLAQTGALSAFNLGMLLLQIPLGVIGVPLGIVLLPALSTEIATGTVERFLGMVGRALRLLVFVMLPIAAIGAVIVNVVVAYAAVGPYGLDGLAFAIAAGAWLEATVLLVILRQRHPEFDVRGLAVTFSRSLVAALLAGALALATVMVLNGPLPIDAGKVAVLGRAVIAGGIGALGYLAMSLVLRAPELPALVGVATDLVRRPRAA